MARSLALCVVPARLGSSRFPGKVLAELAGKPLVRHAYERASAASLVGAVVVATDSPEVERAVARFGGRVVRVDVPCPTGSDRVAAAAKDLPGDLVVNLQADQPRIHPSDIDRVIGRLVSAPDLDMTTLAFRSEDPAGYASRDVVKVVTDGRGRALYFSRAGIPASRDASGTPWYFHHVGIYCFRRAALERFAALPQSDLERLESLEQLRALEDGMSIGVVLSDSGCAGVDRERDLDEAVRALASEGPRPGEGPGEDG
ncbi:MAG: 3-deoxy-manno-octulosonate cytidylyltransferase [Candidatus Eisenbacteria bacterium]|nr:3-deoxy-manno-octulosonate cytidylyltransferase [Candidatus Eisenbacteria bacterium]